MKIVTDGMIENISAKALSEPRRRIHHVLSEGEDDLVRRFVNVMSMETYVRPHRHSRKGMWELLAALSGAAVVLIFDDRGMVLERVEISPAGPNRLVEFSGGEWHTVAPLTEGTSYLEVKPGPFKPIAAEDFAVWAPAEADPATACFRQWHIEAKPGDFPPRF